MDNQTAQSSSGGPNPNPPANPWDAFNPQTPTQNPLDNASVTPEPPPVTLPPSDRPVLVTETLPPASPENFPPMPPASPVTPPPPPQNTWEPFNAAPTLPPLAPSPVPTPLNPPMPVASFDPPPTPPVMSPPVETPQPLNPENVVSIAADANPPKKSGGRTLLMIVLILVILAILGAVGVFAYQSFIRPPILNRNSSAIVPPPQPTTNLAPTEAPLPTDIPAPTLTPATTETSPTASASARE